MLKYNRLLYIYRKIAILLFQKIVGVIISKSEPRQFISKKGQQLFIICLKSHSYQLSVIKVKLNLKTYQSEDWIFNPFATRHPYMHQLFHCLQWYTGSKRVNHLSLEVQVEFNQRQTQEFVIVAPLSFLACGMG